MNDLLAQVSESQAAGFLLVLGRISPLFLLAPLFSSKMFPARARGITAVALAVGIAPLVARGERVPLEIWELGGLMLKEVLVGLAFAFALAAMFAAVQVAGSFVDTLTGFAFAAIVDPITGNQSAVVHNLYSLVGVAIFVTIGGDAWVVQGLARSYEAIPLLAAPDIGSLAAGANAAFSGIFMAGLEVAAPIVLALILTDAAFGLVSRVVPQLNVFAVGFPAKITVGLMIIGVSLPFVASWIEDELQRSVHTALDTLRVAG